MQCPRIRTALLLTLRRGSTDLSGLVRADTVYGTTYTGTHPVLGFVTAIQDLWSHILVMFTELPWPEWLTLLAESGEPVGGNLGCSG